MLSRVRGLLFQGMRGGIPRKHVCHRVVRFGTSARSSAGWIWVGRPWIRLDVAVIFGLARSSSNRRAPGLGEVSSSSSSEIRVWGIVRASSAMIAASLGLSFCLARVPVAVLRLANPGKYQRRLLCTGRPRRTAHRLLRTGPRQPEPAAKPVPAAATPRISGDWEQKACRNSAANTPILHQERATQR